MCTRGLTVLIYLIYCYKKVDSISSKKIKIRHKCNNMIISWKKGKFTCNVKNYFVNCRIYIYCVWLLGMYSVFRISRNLTWLHKNAFMAHQLINHFAVTSFRSYKKLLSTCIVCKSNLSKSYPLLNMKLISKINLLINCIQLVLLRIDNVLCSLHTENEIRHM